MRKKPYKNRCKTAMSSGGFGTTHYQNTQNDNKHQESTNPPLLIAYRGYEIVADKHEGNLI